MQLSTTARIANLTLATNYGPCEATLGEDTKKSEMILPSASLDKMYMMMAVLQIVPFESPSPLTSI